MSDKLFNNSIFVTISNFHKKFLSPEWSKKRFYGHYGFIIILFFIVISCSLTLKSRLDQWNVWLDNSNITFFNNEPTLSTADGGYFIKKAKILQHGGNTIVQEQQRLFPEKDPNYLKSNSSILESEQIKSNQTVPFYYIPLLSYVINWLGDLFFNGQLLLTGNILIPWLGLASCLFIVLAFYSLGFGLEGSVAAVGSCLAQSHLIRTSIGRVDTDLLNVGLFYAVISLIGFSIYAKNQTRKYLFIILAGVFCFIFIWWYQKPGFIIPFLFIIFFGHYFYSKSFSQLILICILFIFFSGPPFVYHSFSNLIGSFKNYLLLTQDIKSGLFFPDTHMTITELTNLNLFEYLSLISGQGTEWIAILGIFGFLVFFITNPLRGFILLPAMSFILLTLLSGKRFNIYIAPLVWFGFAFLITSFINYLFTAFANRNFLKNHKLVYFNTISSLFIFFLICLSWSVSPASCRENYFLSCTPKYIPKPSVNNNISKGFERLKTHDKNNNGVVITWWDYGYWVNLISGLATVHDPGIQNTPKTYLVANALTSTSQEKSAEIFNYVSSNNLSRVNSHATNINNFNIKINDYQSFNKPIYLFLTNRMIDWWGTISLLGNWNIEKGLSENVQGFVNFDCNPKSEFEILCGNAILDVRTGKISNGNQLQKLIITRNGNKIREYDYNNQKGQVSLIIQLNGDERLFIGMEPELADSTFTELFLLNQPNSQFYTLIEDGWPYYRIFKLNL